MEPDKRLILALDETDTKRALDVANATSHCIDAIKVNWPLVLSAGPDVVRKLGEFGPVICDFKVADIPNTCRLIVEQTARLGAAGIVVQGFVGSDSVRECVRASGGRLDVFVVCEMSHPGGAEFTAPVADRIAQMARDCGAAGIIAPATRPEHVAALRRVVGDLLILSPGVGAQGGSAADVIRAGADFVIVGRSVYQSKDPKAAAEAVAEEIRRVLRDG